MIIDSAVIAVVVTIIISLLGLSAWAGALHQKVKENRDYIEGVDSDFKSFQKENKADHASIVAKLDTIILTNRKG